MAKVELEQVIKAYGNLEVIHGVDLQFEHGEFVVFVGPSGCGKSTLLRMIAGLEEITRGELRIDGRRVNEVPAARRGTAMVFQSYALYPHKTVRENMAFGLKMARTPRDEINARVRDAAGTLVIDELLERKPRELSGGQRQRVAIGRAIVREPKVFLLDEPLSNLDAALRGQMRLELSRLHERIDATMIHVTHDQVEAMTLAERIVVLRDGRVEQVGTPRELYLHPANRFVAGFLGSPPMNFLDSRVVTSGDGWIECLAPGDLRLRVGVVRDPGVDGGGVVLGIRPEDLRLGRRDHGVVVSGRVVHMEYLGSVLYVHAECASEDGPTWRLVLMTKPDTRLQAGQSVEVTIDARTCHVFDGAGVSVTAFSRGEDSTTG